MIITDFSNLPSFISGQNLALDIETHDPNLKTKGPGALRGDGRIVGIGLVTNNGQWYLTESVISQKNNLIEWFKQWKFDLIMGQNILYDLEWLACYGIKFSSRFFLDSMFAEAILNPNGKKDLDTLANKYLKDAKKSNEVKDYIVNVLKKPEKLWQGLIHLVPKELAGPYCLKDAELAVNILREQKKELIKDGLLDVFKKECSLIPILLEMKLKGIKVNQHKIRDYYYLINEEISQTQKKLGSLNVNAPKEVSEFLKKKDLT